MKGTPVLEALRNHVLPLARTRVISDVRIGLTYTAVLLDNGSTGLAYTFHHDIPPGCSAFQGVRPLAGQPAAEVVRYLTSADLLERTVGIAAANALCNHDHALLIPGDTLELLNPGPEDTVGMVGYFGPLVPALKQKVKKLMIFEKIREKAEEVYPEEQAFSLLPSCSLAIITSTTLINRTLEQLLAAAENCRTIALVGPSTPLAREPFQSAGVQVLSGVIVTDPHGILRIVSEGGGMRFFKGHIKKVNMKLD